MGFFISFPGSITYPKNDDIRKVIEHIPVDHLLVETDCPYLAPQPKRGRRNEPALVRFTAEKLAEIRITSYNVCYTKLLRNVFLDSGHWHFL